MKLLSIPVILRRTIFSVFCVYALPPTSSHAEPLASVKRAGLALDLTQEVRNLGSTESFQLKIKTGQFEAVDIFDLKNPKRIVLDFLGVKNSFQNSLELEKNKAIQRIRFGKHPDKLRIVLDMEETQNSSYSWTQSNDSLIMKIKSRENARENESQAVALDRGIERQPREESTNQARQPVAKAPLETSARISSPNSTNVMAKLKESENTPLDSKEKRHIERTIPAAKPRKVFIPEMEPQSKAAGHLNNSQTSNTAREPVTARITERTEQLPKPVLEEPSSSQYIQSITYEYLAPNNVPALKVQLSAKPAFSLTKKSSLEYQLHIKNCDSGGDHNLLPYFPPQDFKGMLGLVAEETDNGMLINLRVEPATRVNSFVRDNTIFVRAFPIHESVHQK